jgi:hypothetical protein
VHVTVAESEIFAEGSVGAATGDFETVDAFEVVGDSCAVSVAVQSGGVPGAAAVAAVVVGEGAPVGPVVVDPALSAVLEVAAVVGNSVHVLADA